VKALLLSLIFDAHDRFPIRDFFAAAGAVDLGLDFKNLVLLHGCVVVSSSFLNLKSFSFLHFLLGIT
jgi:hypothetical protein